MPRRLNELQVSVLEQVARGGPFADFPYSLRGSARTVHSRGLIKISGRGPTWHAVVTEAGHHYLRHGNYPAPPPEPEPVSAKTGPSTADPAPPLGTAYDQDWEVESPRAKRERGHKPKGDDFFDERNPDPWDEKILVSVKEAAWMLSLTENAIRNAAVAGDLDRVYIGGGSRSYRIVYGSLLAWVNSMPRESAANSWWR